MSRSGDTTAPVIDWHAHWIPPEVTELFESRSDPPRIVREGATRLFLTADGGRFTLKDHQLDLERRQDEMRAAGIDRQVLSLAVLYGAGLDRLDATLEPALVAAFNAGLARRVVQAGSPFAGLAALPVHDLAAAPAILERAVGEQGLLGAVLPAEAFANKASAVRYRPLFAVATRIRAHLFVHPGAWTLPEDRAAQDEAAIVRRRAVRFQNDLTAAALTFERTDFLAPYPDAVVHLANLGGTLALLADRIAHTARRMGLPEGQEDGRLHRIVVDTASFGGIGVTLAATTLGAERLVLGSDSPALALAPAVEGVRDANLDEDARQAILCGRAAVGASDSLAKKLRAPPRSVKIRP